MRPAVDTNRFEASEEYFCVSPEQAFSYSAKSKDDLYKCQPGFKKMLFAILFHPPDDETKYEINLRPHRMARGIPLLTSTAVLAPSRPPRSLEPETLNGFFSGRLFSKPERVVRWVRGGEWYYEDGTAFLGGSELMLDGPKQSDPDFSGVSKEVLPKRTKLDLLVSEYGCLSVLTGLSEKMIHSSTANIWLLDIENAGYLQSRFLKVPGKDAKVCVYSFVIGKDTGERRAESPTNFLPIPLDDEGGVVPMKKGLGGIAAQFSVASPVIIQR